MQFYWFLLGALAVWRITHLLHAEDGPADALVRLRRAAGHGLLGDALDCFYCLSVWVAAPVALWVGSAWPERALLWPALSAAAIFMERIGHRADAEAPSYHEDKEVPHGVLRREEATLVRDHERDRDGESGRSPGHDY